MSKKNRNGSLGNAMLKHRLHKGVNSKTVWVHTSELPDNMPDWNRINFNSVTEQNSLDEFLTTAELAGTEFTSEKLNINFVSKNQTGIISNEERVRIKKAQDENRDLLRIPRRPLWKDYSELNSEEYELKERESFLEWRRKLAELQETQNIKLTPFEKNIEFWRQLWRVIERSDLIVQIVDARNPLLFRCEDLENYVKEVDKNKINLILVNKSDYLSEKQRLEWLKYFEKNNIKVVFWSALMAGEEKSIQNDVIEEEVEDEDEKEEDEEEEEEREEEEEEEEEKEEEDQIEMENMRESLTEIEQENNPEKEKCKILNREELISLLKDICKHIPKQRSNITTVGMVGYPNVGKSSTINAILQTKRVAVSDTPGKTKHYQTLHVDDELVLCDCPGLVFPSFVSTRGDLILNGILPVDQMRDYVEPINLIAHQLPKKVFEIQYGLILPQPKEGEDPLRGPTAEELCSTYAISHGFMNHKGIPDVQRAARCLLKDYINGKLVYCYVQPNVNDKEFQEIKIDALKETRFMERLKKINEHKSESDKQNEFDREFFKQLEPKMIIKSSARMKASQHTLSLDANTNKPWKKHHKKKEKLRRLYSHLDA
jgi:large subunit GTPase 1